ncbi:MAG: TolC family protein [Elusimicrobiota bacterium]
MLRILATTSLLPLLVVSGLQTAQKTNRSKKDNMVLDIQGLKTLCYQFFNFIPRTIRILFCLTFLIYNYLYSQPLTLRDVIIEAKKNNPTLIKAEKSVKLARLQYQSSFTNFLPQLSANAGVSQTDSDGSCWSKGYSYGFSGKLSVFSGFSDISNTSSKNIQLSIAETDYKKTLSNTVFNLKKSFMELLWSQESVKLAQEILKRRTENYELVKFKYDAGREDRGSLLRVEADKYQAEYELSKAKRSVVSASSELLKDMGRDSNSVSEIPTAAGSFTLDESMPVPVFGEVLLNIPDYVIAKNNLEKSEYDLTSAKSQLYPEISLSGSASKTGDRWTLSNDNRSVSLGLSYPFFPGGRNYYDIKISQTNKVILEEAFRSTRQQLVSTLSSVWNDFINAVESVKVSQMYFLAAQEQSKITSTKYINGLTSYQDWYTVENDFTNSQRSLLNAKKNAVIAEANWKNVIGMVE